VVVVPLLLTRGSSLPAEQPVGDHVGGGFEQFPQFGFSVPQRVRPPAEAEEAWNGTLSRLFIGTSVVEASFELPGTGGSPSLSRWGWSSG
jgi:hypothetical protein